MTTSVIQPGEIIGGQYNATPLVLSDQQTAAAQMDSAGNFKMVLAAGSAIAATVDIDQTTPGTTNGVNFNPTANAAAGIAPVVSAALETGHVIKNGAGNLYGLDVVTTGAAGYVLIFNSTTVPTAGAVTPIDFAWVPAFGSVGMTWNPPLKCATGISVAFSIATTPFTKTDSATAAFSGLAV